MHSFLLAAVIAFQTGPLANDPRLAAAPGLKFTAAPLSVVLKEFTKATNVSIECSNAIEEDLVTMWTADKSAGEVLDMLAKHFGWTWQSSNNGYILIQTGEAKRKEEQERERLYVQELAGEREQAAKWLEDAKKADPKETQKKLEALYKILEAANEKSEKPDFALYDQIQQLMDLNNPGKKFASECLVNLTDTQLASLRRRTRLVLSYYPTAAQSPLPKSAQATAEEWISNLTKEKEVASAPSGDEEFPMQKWKPVKPQDISTVRVVFKDYSTFFGYSSLAATMHVVGKDGTIIDENYASFAGSPFGEFTQPQKAYRDDVFKVRVVPNAELKAELDWKPTSEADQFIRHLGNFLQVGGTDPLLPRAKVLVEIARSANLPLIADAYDDSFTFSGMFMPRGETLGDLLSTSLDPGSTATMSDGWLRVRSDKWQVSRAATTPRSILLTIRDTAYKTGLNLDALASLANKLSEEQASSWPMMLAAGMEMMESKLSDRAGICMLRVWHHLGLSQRHRLLSGGAVPVDSLTPTARMWLNEYLYRLGERETSEGSMMFDGEMEEVALPPEGQVVQRDYIVQDTEITQVLPRGPIPGASIRLSTQGKYGVCVKVQLGPFPLEVSLPVFTVAELFEGAERQSGVQLIGVKPSNMVMYSFDIECAPGIRRGYDVVTATSDPSVPFGKPEDLPVALRSALQAARERYKKRKQAEPPPPPHESTASRR